MTAQETILFRSITPFLSYFMPPSCDPLVKLEGDIDGYSFKLEIVEVSGWNQAKKSIFEPWAFSEEEIPDNIVLEVANTSRGNAYLVIEHSELKTDTTKISVNTGVSVTLQAAAERALMLFWDCLGPYTHTTWSLQYPSFGAGYGHKLVSMNDFLCTKSGPAPRITEDFDNVYRRMLDANWRETQFGNILDMSFELISSSLRTLKPAHSFVFLAMAFETLFAKKENDWAGASRRLARLIGNSKGEVTEIYSKLNDGIESVRQLRNDLVHGCKSSDIGKASEKREMLAPWLSKAIIHLITEFRDHDKYDCYYEGLSEMADIRFELLPSKLD